MLPTLIIDFSSHKAFNTSVKEWENSAVSALELINTWSEYNSAGAELDSNMRSNFEVDGTFLEAAKYFWIAAAVFMAYCRLAKTRWPEINEDLDEKAQQELEQDGSLYGHEYEDIF